MAASETIAIVIPAVNFNLGGTDFANARTLIDAGAALALTTDINPGSAPCPAYHLGNHHVETVIKRGQIVRLSRSSLMGKA